MFNTHWILIPMSFFPVGISCGILGITAEGILFFTVIISLCWIHITFYFLCKILLNSDLGQIPVNEFILAFICLIMGYLAAFGYDSLHSFSLSLLAWGVFFIHDFVFGIILLFGGSTFRNILLPVSKRKIERRFYTDITYDDDKSHFNY